MATLGARGHRLFSFLLFFSLPSLALTCNPADLNALLTVKSYLQDRETFATWTASSDCCRWLGVRCAADSRRVVSLQISGTRTLSGSLPLSIADLSNLENLIISGFQDLTGPIPPLERLQNLAILDLSRNSLTGHVPSALSKNHQLISINLSNNKLTGTIPPDLFTLPKLASLDLSSNQIAGSIPASIGNHPANLQRLRLSNNRLSGEIPLALSKHRLQLINLSNNQLVGDASMLLGQERKSLEVFIISGNQLRFDLGKATFPNSIKVLNMSNNKIYGRIPIRIGSLTNLVSLDLSENELCGKFPRKWFYKFGKNAFLRNACLTV